MTPSRPPLSRWRTAAWVGCFLLGMSLWSVAPAQEAQEAQKRAAAQAFMDGGRFQEAALLLQPWVAGQAARADTLFLYGLAALQASQQANVPPDARHRWMRQAIASFRALLFTAPGLVRVRLELARAFFLNRQDGLARRHFERVLAGGVPPPVAANVQRFLNALRARQRWSGYVGAAIAPDSNLNAASDTETIYVDIFGSRLPFQRQGDVGARSGLGLSIWGGGEYQQPLTQRLRLRAAADLVQRDYGGRDFDQLLLAARLGPRWLTSPRTEISLLATAQRHWLGQRPYVDETGGRLELDRRLTPRLWARASAALRQRDHHALDILDGPLTDFSLHLVWAAAPVLRLQLLAGYERDHAASPHWRNLSRWLRLGASLILPRGFTLGASAQLRRTSYQGNGCAHQVLDCVRRLDRTRTFSLSILNRALTLFRFSPQVALIHEARATNAQAQDYHRTRAELRFVRQF